MFVNMIDLLDTELYSLLRDVPRYCFDVSLGEVKDVDMDPM